MWTLFKKKTPPTAVTASVPLKETRREEGGLSYSAITQRLVALPDDGRLRVVGESHYQPALRAVTGGKAAGDGLDDHFPVTAALVPEPENAWDSKAVRVDVLVGDRTVKVGYLPSEIAGEFQPHLLKLRAQGSLGTCPARVAGGGDKYYGIYLHLARARRLAGTADPVIAKRTADGVLLHNDWSCTVTGEERHQDILGDFAPNREDETRELIATLDFCEIERGKYTGEQAIEVRVRGHRVGQLTYAMSQRYGDIVRTLRDQRLSVACEAFTILTKRGIEIELLLPRAPRKA